MKKSWWEIKVNDRHVAKLGIPPFWQGGFCLFFLGHIMCCLLKETLYLSNLYEFTFLNPQSEQLGLMLWRCRLPCSYPLMLCNLTITTVLSSRERSPFTQRDTNIQSLTHLRHKARLCSNQMSHFLLKRKTVFKLGCIKRRWQDWELNWGYFPG